jgi:hypothetical protein
VALWWRTGGEGERERGGSLMRDVSAELRAQSRELREKEK